MNIVACTRGGLGEETDVGALVAAPLAEGGDRPRDGRGQRPVRVLRDRQDACVQQARVPRLF